MPYSNIIAADVFCTNHQVELTFIRQLQDHGLIETSFESEQTYIPEDQLPALEKMVRLHTDLNLDATGIETVFNLLQRIEHLQQQIVELRNTVAFFNR